MNIVWLVTSGPLDNKLPEISCCTLFGHAGIKDNMLQKSLEQICNTLSIQIYNNVFVTKRYLRSRYSSYCPEFFSISTRVATVPGFSVFRSFSLFPCQAWVSVQSFPVPSIQHFQVIQLKSCATNSFVCHPVTAFSSSNMI